MQPDEKNQRTTESERESNMTTTSEQFLTAENIQTYTNHRFLKFDHMLNLPRFRNLCQSAKLLYTYMLDRLHLSEKNSSRFSDERGLFIFFSYDEIMEKIGCAKAKAAGLLSDLEQHGLIARKRCIGSAKKKIYLPVIELTEAEQAQIQVAEKQESHHCETLLREIAERYHWSESDVAAAIRKMFAAFEITYGVGFTPEDVQRGTVEKARFDNQTQESSEIELPIESDLPQQDLPTDDHSIDEKSKEAKKDYETCFQQAKSQVSGESGKVHGSILETASENNTAREELASVMAWAYTTPKASLKIGGVDVSTSTICRKLQRITPQHVSNILQNLKSTHSIRNRKSYLLTCLFHEADTVRQTVVRSCTNRAAYQSFIYNLN